MPLMPCPTILARAVRAPLALLCLVLAGVVHAQPGDGAQQPVTQARQAAEAAQAARAADVASAAQAMLAPAGTAGDAASRDAAKVVAMNRTVATLRASVLGWPASERAKVASVRIQQLLDEPGDHEVSLEDLPEGTIVRVDGRLLFALLIDDTVPRTRDAASQDARRAAAVLKRVVDETRESRNLRSLLLSAGVAALATLVMVALFWLLYRSRRRLQLWLTNKTLRHIEQLRIGGMPIVGAERLLVVERGVMRLLYWSLVLLVVYQWLGIVLGQFPYTRVWGEQLNGFLFGMLKRFALAIAHAIPDLLAAALIFAIALGTVRLLKSFFRNVQSGRIVVGWLDAEVALVTSRICIIAVWLFALAMAYPYLPGSQTDAFKGVSVLVGLMISLGTSNLVGQAASGLILTYTRTLRNGEYVRVADHEGTVMNLGAFTTRIRTGLGEELTISNSQVLGAVTKNYSRAVKGKGYVLDAVLTIGYDTPWRQVSAMLVEAAHRTPGVLDDPQPRVFQTALSDFYPEYRLVCQAIPTEPRPRAEVMDALHANIQDVFNEHGVQIMSPHYVNDPQQSKVVAPEQWYAPPAKAPAKAPG